MIICHLLGMIVGLDARLVLRVEVSQTCTEDSRSMPDSNRTYNSVSFALKCEPRRAKQLIVSALQRRRTGKATLVSFYTTELKIQITVYTLAPVNETVACL
jgi:hypothetical protein